MKYIKHEISSNDIGNGIIEKRSISFDIKICDYYSCAEKDYKEKKMLQISINVHDETIKDEEILTEGEKSSNFIFDFELKDEEDIYSFACALSCILDNGLSHALSKPIKWKNKPE